MKKYFNVTYRVSDDIWSANLAHAESENDILSYYANESGIRSNDDIIISDANDYAVEDAQRRGKPIVEVEHAEQEREQEAPAETQEPAENVLYLEKRGCSFFSGDPVVSLSDVGNYRVVTHGECIPAPNGRMYCFEFCHYDRYRYRTENKRTGKPLKHPVKELVNPNACSIHSQFSDSEGCWGDLKLEEKFYSENHSYTVAELLSIVNGISSQHYDRIIFADQEAIEAIPSIRRKAGWRENAILDSLQEVVFVEAAKDYTVYRFIGIIDGEERSFEYEAKSGRITG